MHYSRGTHQTVCVHDNHGPRYAYTTSRPDDFTNWPKTTFPLTRWFAKLLDTSEPKFWAFVFCQTEEAARRAATQWVEHGSIVESDPKV